MAECVNKQMKMNMDGCVGGQWMYKWICRWQMDG